jgi:hypothetical protein
VTVVLLEVDFAGLLWAWNAGAFSARIAADCNGGKVFVKVVVVLGTEPVLVARSYWRSWASSCAALDGTAIFKASLVSPVLLPQNVEKTPKATDCLVVVAGVNSGGSASDSAGAAACGCGCPSQGLLASLMFTGAFGTVDNVLLELLQVNAWLLCSAV